MAIGGSGVKVSPVPDQKLSIPDSGLSMVFTRRGVREIMMSRWVRVSLTLVKSLPRRGRSLRNGNFLTVLAVSS